VSFAKHVVALCCGWILFGSGGALAQPAQPKPPEPPAPQPEAPQPEAPKAEPAPRQPDDDDDDDVEDDDDDAAPAPDGPKRPSEDPDADPKEAAAQRKRERERPRTALPDVEPPEPPPWGRRIEVGASFAFVLRPYANGNAESQIGYSPAPGFGVHLHWEFFPWLRFHPYFVHAFHSVDVPAGALASGTSISIPADATISDTTVATFVIGAKLAPTYPFTDRIRAWVTLGVGWGRFEFPIVTVTETSGDSYEVRRRAGTQVEFPLGVGVAFDVIEHWLSVEYEATAAPVTGQSGSAYEIFQTTDVQGAIRDVGPYGAIEASFVQTLGVSLIL
jgi:hypothetical protein